MRTRALIPLAMVTAIFALTGCDGAQESRPSVEPTAAEQSDADMVVYKSPACGCCDLWIDHVEENGFSVATVDIVEYDAIVAQKREHGVALDLGSCHTTVVGGYVVEGHVPAHVIQRLLEEQPDIHGIAVPGMPIGSPGMAGPNPMPYQVIAIGRDGSRSIFETVDPRLGDGGSGQ